MLITPFLLDKIQECRQMYNLGSTSNDLIESLHDEGLSLNEVCIVIGHVLDIDPAEAHVFVADNPIWVEVVDQASPVIKEVMQVLDRDGDVQHVGDGVVVFREPLAGKCLLPGSLPTVAPAPSY